MADQRPRAESRSFTAPSLIGMNGHFASVGDAAHDPKAYEHGVQVIDEDKEFKLVVPCSFMGINLPLLTNIHFKSKSVQVPLARRCHQRRLQLPPYICVRIAINRKIYSLESSFRHPILGHVRQRTKTDDKRYLDVKKQDEA